MVLGWLCGAARLPELVGMIAGEEVRKNEISSVKSSRKTTLLEPPIAARGVTGIPFRRVSRGGSTSPGRYRCWGKGPVRRFR